MKKEKKIIIENPHLEFIKEEKEKSMMKKVIENYDKPTPKFFRRIGDSLLVLGTTLSGSYIVEGNSKAALISLIATILGKILTNFKS